MSPKKLERMMIESIFDELPPEKRDFFQEKLKRDPALQRDYAELQAILEETRGLNAAAHPPALSPEISARILAKARSEAEHLAARKNRPKFWSILPAFRYAFTTVMVASLAFWVGHERALRQTALQHQGSLISMTDTIEQLEEARAQEAKAAAKPAPAPVTVSQKPPPEPVPVQAVSVAEAEPSHPIPTSVSDQMQFARIYTKNQNWSQALQNYRTIATLAPQSYEGMLAYHQSARIHVKSGDLQKALNYYEALLKEYPDYRHRNQVLLESGRVYAKRRQWDKALTNLQKVYDEYPDMRSQVLPHLYYVKQNLHPAEESLPEVSPGTPQEVLDTKHP